MRACAQLLKTYARRDSLNDYRESPIVGGCDFFAKFRYESVKDMLKQNMGAQIMLIRRLEMLFCAKFFCLLNGYGSVDKYQIVNWNDILEKGGLNFRFKDSFFQI